MPQVALCCKETYTFRRSELVNSLPTCQKIRGSVLFRTLPDKHHRESTPLLFHTSHNHWPAFLTGNCPIIRRDIRSGGIPGNQRRTQQSFSHGTILSASISVSLLCNSPSLSTEPSSRMTYFPGKPPEDGESLPLGARRHWEALTQGPPPRGETISTLFWQQVLCGENV